MLEEDNFSILTTTCGVSPFLLKWFLAEHGTDTRLHGCELAYLPKHFFCLTLPDSPKFSKKQVTESLSTFGLSASSRERSAGCISLLIIPSYFLLCGYTPFDRDSQFEEMQAICNGDFQFEPVGIRKDLIDISDHATSGRVLVRRFGNGTQVCSGMSDSGPHESSHGRTINEA